MQIYGKTGMETVYPGATRGWKAAVRTESRRRQADGEKIMKAAQIIALIVAIGIWGAVIWQEVTKPEPVIGVDYYPMANQHITWTWAKPTGGR